MEKARTRDPVSGFSAASHDKCSVRMFLGFCTFVMTKPAESQEEEYRASEHNVSEEHKVSEGQTAETQMIAGPGDDDEMASQSAETQARPQDSSGHMK